jgi:hypothetical protein
LNIKTKATVYEWFGLKTTRTIFSDLTLKLVAWVSRFVSQNQPLWFGDLSIKITMVDS